MNIGERMRGEGYKTEFEGQVDEKGRSESGEKEGEKRRIKQKKKVREMTRK